MPVTKTAALSAPLKPGSVVATPGKEGIRTRKRAPEDKLDINLDYRLQNRLQIRLIARIFHAGSPVFSKREVLCASTE